MLDVIEKVMGIAEAAAIVGALAAAWFEFRRAEREASFANYADHMKGFLEMTQLLVEKPELHDIYNYTVADDDREYAELTAAEKSRLQFMQTVRRLVRQGHENLKAGTEAVGA